MRRSAIQLKNKDYESALSGLVEKFDLLGYPLKNIKIAIVELVFHVNF